MDHSTLERGEGEPARSVIIVSPYFPPSTLAGVHRARLLAKHLPAAGWRPTVLCVDETYHEERLDPDLAALVPASVEIIKVRALPVGVTRLLGLGDISLRALGHLKRALFHMLKTRRVGAVLITASPYFPMLFTGEIKRRFGVPVVLDFQDPWVSAWGAEQPLASKAGISHWLATQLEPRALRSAAYVTSVSEAQNAEMATRYPWLDAKRMAAIPIGGDPEDFAAVQTASGSDVDGYLASGRINLSYVGTFMPRSEPLMRILLQAFAQLRRQQPDAAASVRLNFIGTSNQPNDTTSYRVRPLAEAEGVADAVWEVPERVPYLTALACLVRSDAVLLIGSDEAHYTASKIYPGLMSGRPYLSLFHRASSAHTILTSAGGGLSYSFSTLQDLAGLVGTLADGLGRLVTAPQSLGQAAASAYVAYSGEAIARRFAGIFDEIRTGAFD